MIRRHRRTVIRLINSLCQQGFIERDGKHGRFRRLRVLFTPDLVARCHTEPNPRSRSRSKAKEQRHSPPSPPTHLAVASYLVITCLVHAILNDGVATQNSFAELQRRLHLAHMTPAVGIDLPKLIAAARAQRQPTPTPQRVLQRVAHTVRDDVDVGILDARDVVEEFKCRLARARLRYHTRDVQRALDAAEFQRRRAA